MSTRVSINCDRKISKIKHLEEVMYPLRYFTLKLIINQYKMLKEAV